MQGIAQPYVRAADLFLVLIHSVSAVRAGAVGRGAVDHVVKIAELNADVNADAVAVGVLGLDLCLYVGNGVLAGVNARVDLLDLGEERRKEALRVFTRLLEIELADLGVRASELLGVAGDLQRELGDGSVSLRAFCAVLLPAKSFALPARFLMVPVMMSL